MAPKALGRYTTDSRLLAKQWLTKGGVLHEDSDDELGCDDLPWEWIYDAKKEDNGTVTAQREIIGARMGSFECRIGQPVLLKSPEPGKDWAGIICEFLEEAAEDDDSSNEDSLVKSANIMWFASPAEFLSTKNKRRADALPKEQYITVDFNVNPLTSINGKATVLSKDAFYKRYPYGKAPRGRVAVAEYNKCIICRRGVSQVQGKYTEEFVWENIYSATEAGIFKLIQKVTEEIKASRKRKVNEAEHSSRKADPAAPTTPRKRQKTTTVRTPEWRQQKNALSTPTHRRIVVKKPLEFTPLATRTLSPSHFTSSPYRQARNLLHAASVPESLPCRDTEFHTVYDSLCSAITEGSGACIYISGPPGTGKTATVREVISRLNGAVISEEMDDFIFVEINGMKVTDPHQSYSLLWEALKGDRVSPSHALALLEREFSRPSPRRVPCVVLMDELDQLVTKNQSIMYNFFNWPALRHSHLVVLAVANTMDLPERTLSNKISSRLGLTRITFSGYKHQDLIAIIESRLANVPGNIVDSDAIQFASRKVAAVSGDARRALDICRRAVEIAEQGSEVAGKAGRTISVPDMNQDLETESLPPTPSKSARGQRRGKNPFEPQRRDRCQQNLGNDHEPAPLPRVTIATIKQAIQEATSTPLQQSLSCLPLSGKVFLSGLLARIRRTGVAESNLGDILDEARRIADGAVAVAGTAGAGSKAFLLNCCDPRVSSMGFAAVELINAGIVAVEGETNGKRGQHALGHVLGKSNRNGRVRLRIAAQDIRVAFRDDAEAKMLGLGLDT